MFRKGCGNPETLSTGRIRKKYCERPGRIIEKHAPTFLFVTAVALATMSFADASYPCSQKIKIGGDGGWDYVTSDPTARRLYVSHGTKVDVLDLDSLKIVGTIPETPGVHCVALAPKLKRGFVSEGKADTVEMFRPVDTEENRFDQNRP